MDFAPLTLFFLVCLLHFQGNVLGKPATDVAAFSTDLWVQQCEEELNNKNYCTKKLNGYNPFDEQLKKLYYDRIGNFDFRPQFNQTEDRVGERNICRNYLRIIKDISMIRDEHNNTRFTLNIPHVYEVSIPVEECQPDASFMLDSKYKIYNITCVQKSYQYPFIVLAQDKKRLEFVKILGLNSSCSPAVQC